MYLVVRDIIVAGVDAPTVRTSRQSFCQGLPIAAWSSNLPSEKSDAFEITKATFLYGYFIMTNCLIKLIFSNSFDFLGLE